MVSFIENVEFLRVVIGIRSSVKIEILEKKLIVVLVEDRWEVVRDKWDL